jgi:membrane-bound metal-dependent hydrolase YbcI (DUF457 family)
MDVISHILLTNLVFKSEPMANRMLAVVFGILPDFISFGGMFNSTFLKRILFFKKPPKDLFPAYVMKLYDVCHSLIIWLGIFIILWLVGFKWLAIAFCGWGFHILLDVFTHSRQSFPTKILWPLSNFAFSGLSWSSKWFMLFNYLLIAFLYLVFYF